MQKKFKNVEELNLNLEQLEAIKIYLENELQNAELVKDFTKENFVLAQANRESEEELKSKGDDFVRARNQHEMISERLNDLEYVIYRTKEYECYEKESIKDEKCNCSTCSGNCAECCIEAPIDEKEEEIDYDKCYEEYAKTMCNENTWNVNIDPNYNYTYSTTYEPTYTSYTNDVKIEQSSKSEPTPEVKVHSILSCAVEMLEDTYEGKDPAEYCHDYDRGLIAGIKACKELLGNFISGEFDREELEDIFFEAIIPEKITKPNLFDSVDDEDLPF